MRRKIAYGGLAALGLVALTVVGMLAWPAWPAPVVASRPADAPPARLVSSTPTSKLAVTRVGHASVLVDFDGEYVLTDPWFSESEEYHHGEPLGLALAELPRLTAVVASHAHFDHFDLKAFAAYPDKAVAFFVGPGMEDAARAAGFTNVHELAPWQTGQTGSLTVTATPGEHVVPEVTYVLQGKGSTVYFGGDTKLVPALDEAALRFPNVDLAILSVNGLQVGGKPVVMNDEEAAGLAGKLHAGVAIPIHYAFRGGILSDTFALSYHGTAEGFLRAAKASAPNTDVRILPPGQRLEILHATGDAMIAKP